jgi:autotransporter-associated beta strand protein
MFRKAKNAVAVVILAATPLLTLLTPSIVHAATGTYICTWTGATDTAFATPGNWSGCNSSFPQTTDQDDLVLPVSATNKLASIPAGYTFTNITFNGTGSSGYALTGAAFTVNGDITNSATESGPPHTTIANAITFVGSTNTVSATSATDNSLEFDGAISGTGALVKAGAGSVNFTGNFGLTGAVTVNAGNLALRAKSAAVPTFSGVTVGSGATFNYDTLADSGVSTYTFSKPITSAGTLDFRSTGNGDGTSTDFTINLTGTITLTADSVIEATDHTTVHIQGPLHGPGFVLSATTGSVLNESTDNTTDTPSGELVASADAADGADDGGLDAPDTGFALVSAHPGVTLAITIAAAGALFGAAQLSRKATSRR